MERLTGNDLRIINSKTRIKNGFMNLIEEKPFREITVKEIIHSADVNRSTFYHHYQDKWDLRDQYIQESLEDFMIAFNEFDFSVPINVENLCAFTQQGVEEVYHNLDKYRPLFHPNLEVDILQEMSSIFYKFMLEWIDQQNQYFFPRYSSELFAEIYSASAVATIKMAFKNEKTGINIDYESEKTMRMIRNHLEKGFFRTFIEE